MNDGARLHKNTGASGESRQSPAWHRARAMDLLHEAHDATEKAMRVLGFDDGCRLGDARLLIVAVMDDLRDARG